MLARLFSKRRAPGPSPLPTTGEALVYAVGDIHGRLDLFNALLARICADVLDVGPSHRPSVIFLGDYVDRGPHSRGVIDRILALKREAGFEVRTLKGNHEEQMLLFLDNAEAGPAWGEFGGAQTLMSYGVVPPKTRTDFEGWEEARLALHAALPESHRFFLEQLELAIVCGDYLFVHAGVRPGVPLDLQSERDLLWIRDEFLASEADFGKVVVHGHTPDPAPHLGRNRIGIDTGAYATGTLTGIRLHGEQQFILQSGLRAH